MWKNNRSPSSFFLLLRRLVVTSAAYCAMSARRDEHRSFVGWHPRPTPSSDNPKTIERFSTRCLSSRRTTRTDFCRRRRTIFDRTVTANRHRSTTTISSRPQHSWRSFPPPVSIVCDWKFTEVKRSLYTVFFFHNPTADDDPLFGNRERKHFREGCAEEKTLLRPYFVPN